MGIDVSEAADRGGSRRASAGAVVTKKSGALTLKISGDMKAGIKAFEDSIKGDVVRSGAYAGATVVYDGMRQNAPVESGGLRDSIYRWRDKKRSNGKAIFYIGPNKAKAPHWHLIEFGHWLVNVVVRGADGRLKATRDRLPSPKWVPANPFIRRTYVGKIQSALEAMKLRMSQRIDELKNGQA